MKRKDVREVGSCNASEPGFSHLASSTSQYLMNITCEAMQESFTIIIRLTL